MDIIVKYIDELLEKSTPDAPMWNIEKIRQGLKSNWNYIDGVMIKAVLQMYDVTKDVFPALTLSIFFSPILYPSIVPSS